MLLTGPTYEWADNLLQAWKSFDWYEAQAKMNRAPHFIAAIEDMDIHFVHAKAPPGRKSVPLLMVHGWPGSFWEFSQVWEPLSNPTDPEHVAFDVVVPSMPGFCWSSWPPKSGWTLKDNARVFDKLMKLLGYKQYMVQCGDWGQFVGRELGAQYTDSCKLLHLNFAPSPLPKGAELTQREKAVQDRVDDWVENHIGYAVCMRTRVRGYSHQLTHVLSSADLAKPHTIGFAFHDSPIGILMWVGEKYNEAADPRKQQESFWTEAIITQSCLYFFTGCIMPSMLTYYENVRHHKFAEYAMQPENRIQIPFGYTSFFWDTEPSSKRAVERTGHLVFYNGKSRLQTSTKPQVAYVTHTFACRAR